MKGVQYINNLEGEKRYAVVDLSVWGELFNYFLEEVEDTIVYDEVIGAELDREKLLLVLKEKLEKSKLKFENKEKRENGKPKFQLAE